MLTQFQCVDREIFAGKHFRRLNFRVILFSSIRPLKELSLFVEENILLV